MSELPTTWATVELSEINRFSGRSINPQSSPNIEYELYSVPTFPTGKPELLRGSAIGSTKQTVEPGDVLVCKINPRINRVWSVEPDVGRPQIASSEWIGVRAPSFDSRYLRYFFTSPGFRREIEEGVTGVGGSLTRAQPKRVATFEVPVAPQSEQKRIADRLEAVLAKVGNCHDRLDRVPQILKRFREAVLEAAVSGKLTEEWRAEHHNGAEAWTSGPFELMLAKHDGAIRRGPFGSTVKKSLFVSSGYQVYEQANAIADDCQLRRYFIPESLYKELSSFWVTPGDFIVSCAGTIGRIAQVPSDAIPGIINQALMRIQIDLSVVTPRYFLLHFRSPSFQRSILDNTRGGAMQNLAPVKTVKAMMVSIPSLHEQSEIVRRVDDLGSLADNLERKYEAALKRVEKLTPSVLAKAFRGELVPQDPSDEPAEELLKRIRAEKGASAGVGRQSNEVRRKRHSGKAGGRRSRISSA